MNADQIEQAYERLKRWYNWDGDTTPDPYKDSGYSFHNDIGLLLIDHTAKNKALKQLEDELNSDAHA